MYGHCKLLNTTNETKAPSLMNKVFYIRFLARKFDQTRLFCSFIYVACHTSKFQQTFYFQQTLN